MAPVVTGQQHFQPLGTPETSFGNSKASARLSGLTMLLSTTLFKIILRVPWQTWNNGLVVTCRAWASPLQTILRSQVCLPMLFSRLRGLRDQHVNWCYLRDECMNVVWVDWWMDGWVSGWMPSAIAAVLKPHMMSLTKTWGCFDLCGCTCSVSILARLLASSQGQGTGQASSSLKKRERENADDN